MIYVVISQFRFVARVWNLAKNLNVGAKINCDQPQADFNGRNRVTWQAKNVSGVVFANWLYTCPKYKQVQQGLKDYFSTKSLTATIIKWNWHCHFRYDLTYTMTAFITCIFTNLCLHESDTDLMNRKCHHELHTHFLGVMLQKNPGLYFFLSNLYTTTIDVGR